MYENDLLLHKENGIWIIYLNRPEHLNSFTKPLLEKLGGCFKEAKKDPACRGIIIAGKGPKAFSSGPDVHTFLAEARALGTDWALFGQNVFAQLDDLGKPSIAAVNGLAFGGAFELAARVTNKPPLAVRFAFEAVLRGQNMPINEGMRLEAGLAALAY